MLSTLLPRGTGNPKNKSIQKYKPINVAMTITILDDVFVPCLFISCLLSGRTRTIGFAPIGCRRVQSQHTESISYRVLPYAKLLQIFRNSVIIGHENTIVTATTMKMRIMQFLFPSHYVHNPLQQHSLKNLL